MRLQTNSILSTCRQRLRQEAGLTMIEVLVAMVVLLVGLVGTFDALVSSGTAISAGERYAAMAQVGEQTLQSVESLPYASIADSSAPAVSAVAGNPAYYLSSACSTSSCNYEWNPPSTATEPVVINTTSGKVTPGPTNVVVPSPNASGCTTTSTTNCQMTFAVYTFITCANGVTCSSTSGYVRITVAVVNTGTGAPKNPLYFSAFNGYNLGGSNNPLTSTSTTTCLDGGVTVACVR